MTCVMVSIVKFIRAMEMRQIELIGIDETRGEFLYYNNELANTFYFASSGGY